MLSKSVVALAPFVAMAAAQSNMTATFTHYGSGDQNGSVNCKNPPASQALACGPTSNQVSGYTAAISQNDYGVGPGAGAGPACGECWQITIDQDANGNSIPSATIEVTINNLCPAQGNTEWCDMSSGGTNQHGGDVHFDLCSDTGASSAFFLDPSIGAGKGSASKVQCGSTPPSGSSPGGSSSATQPTTLQTSASTPYGSGSGSSYTPPSAPGSASGAPTVGGGSPYPTGGAGGSTPTPIVPGGGAGASPSPAEGYGGYGGHHGHHGSGKHGHFPGFPYGPSGGKSNPGASAPAVSASSEGEGEDCDE